MVLRRLRGASSMLTVSPQRRAQRGPTALPLRLGDLSLDVQMPQLQEAFFDAEAAVCTLCNEHIEKRDARAYPRHISGNYGHVARSAMLIEMLRPNRGEPEQFVRRCWDRLDASPMFARVPHLVSVEFEPNAGWELPPGDWDALREAHAEKSNGGNDAPSATAPAGFARAGHSDFIEATHDGHAVERRRHRLMRLLRFLRDRRVLKNCFGSQHAGASGASGVVGRSWEFDRLELVGDNCIKYHVMDRLEVLFPVAEGGIGSHLHNLPPWLDSNEMHAALYEYLRLHELTGTTKIISKFKSDVVEALVGELEMFLWSTEVEWGAAESYDHPAPADFGGMRAVVQHALDELCHLILMVPMERSRRSLQRTIKEHGFSFVRSDPSLGGLSTRAHAVAVARKSSYTLSVSPLRVPRPAVGDAASATPSPFFTYVGGLSAQPRRAPTAVSAQRRTTVPAAWLSHMWYASQHPVSNAVLAESLGRVSVGAGGACVPDALGLASEPEPPTASPVPPHQFPPVPRLSAPH